MTETTTRVRNMALTAMFAALLAVAGQIAIPIPPVPITLQTMVVMLAGSVLGARMGAASMLIFILLAAFGVPVLSGGKGGLAALVGPTAGYIWSWPVAAYLIGRWTERSVPRLRFWKLFLYHAVWGIAFVYLCGVLWLVYAVGMDWNAALAGGVLPFIPGDVVKAVLASTVALSLFRAYPIIRSRAGKESAGTEKPA
ncbi:biotin transport system substrate-specific component [Melghirimyces profundicolus]|uniref:Biotin transporter n=1 Tax=Melghirimyces profundicolus TaxID=1242148 RepID=A0A2T6BCD2_9BACL|nr:biotin transporter BioY [Melghirimyces profundicolus]PTX53676.1 biotin transport system substrate-specific component [Melghirimyces profundicolus]